MRKFIVWVGGIVAAVVAPVLVYYLTRPSTPPAPTTFEGMVIDGGHSAPIKEAMVLFEVEPSSQGNGPYHDFTDENGSYKLDVSELPDKVKVTLRAKASGFRESKPVALAALKNDNRTDFVLEPLPSETHTTGSPAATPTPFAQTIPPPNIKLRYIPKTFSQKIILKH